jgi:dTDP-glucose 4,6-dehydratase
VQFHEPVNIGNPEELSMLQLAKECIELAGSSSSIIFKNLPEDDPKVRQPNISRANKLLGWTPVVSRQEGLKKTIEFFKKQILLGL